MVSYTKDNLIGDEGMQAFAAAACEGALPSLRLMYIYGALARDCQSIGIENIRFLLGWRFVHHFPVCPSID